jgi:hypothetical protein
VVAGSFLASALGSFIDWRSPKWCFLLAFTVTQRAFIHLTWWTLSPLSSLRASPWNPRDHVGSGNKELLSRIVAAVESASGDYQKFMQRLPQGLSGRQSTQIF